MIDKFINLNLGASSTVAGRGTCAGPGVGHKGALCRRGRALWSPQARGSRLSRSIDIAPVRQEAASARKQEQRHSVRRMAPKPPAAARGLQQQLLLLLLVLVGPAGAAAPRAPAAGDDPMPALRVCVEPPALASHKGVAVALRTLAAGAPGGAVWTAGCPPRAAVGSDDHYDIGGVRVLRVGVDAALPPQHFELSDQRLVGGDMNGVIYGLLELLPKLLLASTATAAGAAATQRGGPAYKTRVYSIEGQYLDLPDVAYYSDLPPFLNTTLISAEAAAIARGLPALVRNRVTALVVLHPNIEDYITYKYLGNGTEVWPATSPHRQRAAALCPLIAALAKETQAHGLKFYFKPYELGFPKQLQAMYPLGLATPAQINSTRTVLRAKYKELFEATGADGIVLTAEETHPRAGYGSMALAHSPAGVASLAQIFHDAVVTLCGKDLQMRLWRLTGNLRTAGGKPAPDGTFGDFVRRYDPPSGMLYSTKEGDGDFFLRVPDNPLLMSPTAPRLRDFSVELDVFRQYESWGTMLIWMSSWGDRLARYHANGVRGVGMWGDWQGASIWPDCQPGYFVVAEGRNCTADPVSWRIPQDRYYSTIDAFPRDAAEAELLAADAKRKGDSGTAGAEDLVPWRAGDATLFLGAQLAFDPSQNVSALARQYAQTVFGAVDADAVAEALLATEEAFLHRYALPTKQAPQGAYQGWTLIFEFQPTPQQSAVDEALQAHGLVACLAVDAACMAGAARVLAAAKRVVGTSQAAVEIKRSAALTELFLRTNSLFRTLYLINSNISAAASPDQPGLCSELFAPVRGALTNAIQEWSAFPIEGADFNIIAPTPQLVGHHTKYMIPVPMVAYLNGSTGLRYVCKTDGDVPVRVQNKGTATLKTDDSSETSMSLQKLGAWSMQTGETSPVVWKGRTLLVVSMTGDTPGAYPCCTCGTFGCQTLADVTHIGAADCSACQCSAERKAQVGSCAPEYFAIWDWKTLEVLVKIPGTVGFEFASAFVDADTDTLYVYGTNSVNHTARRLPPPPPDNRTCGPGAGQLPCKEFVHGKICNDTALLGQGTKLDSVGACYDWCKLSTACRFFSFSQKKGSPWCIRYSGCRLRTVDDPTYTTYEMDKVSAFRDPFNRKRRVGAAAGTVAGAVSCFSARDPTSAASWTTSSEIVHMPPGYAVFNTDVHAVSGDALAPERKFIMAIETNDLHGKGTSWLTIFAETNASTADRGWRLIDPLAHHVTLERMTACPAVRWFAGWYYVVTTTETAQGAICPQAGHDNYKGPTLCVIVYRSKTLRSADWVLGNGEKPILSPGEDDRRVVAQWSPTAAEHEAIFDSNVSAPQVDGNINDSDFDFCDTPEGVLGVYAGISNQQSNPYFGEATLLANTTSANWLASLFRVPAGSPMQLKSDDNGGGGGGDGDADDDMGADDAAQPKAATCLQPPCPHDENPLWKGYGAAVLSNPLKRLPELPKYHHMSGTYQLYTYNRTFNDDLLYDITRITGAVPLELGYIDPDGPNPAGDAKIRFKIHAAVEACARVNMLGGREAVISMNWSPWMWRFKPQHDPTSTLREADELEFYKVQAQTFGNLINEANVALNASVRVGAVLLDSEQFIWAGYPDAIPPATYWDAVARKNRLMWEATRQHYPSVPPENISWYSRGAVHWHPHLNETECLRGRKVLEGMLPAGYCMGTDVAIDPAFDKASPFTVPLYAIQEPEMTRQDFLHTADAAVQFGVKHGAVIPYVALGVGHRRCIESMPLSPGQVPAHPRYPGSLYIEPNSGWFDPANTYDFAYSALIGAMINQKRFEASAYGPWEQVPAVIFYPALDTDMGLPSKVTAGSTNTMDHFVAYVRAAAGIA
eukprot:SAG22_NODE_670_length_7987_cov_2.733519_1_plen_1844_part_00